MLALLGIDIFAKGITHLVYHEIRVLDQHFVQGLVHPLLGHHEAEVIGEIFKVLADFTIRVNSLLQKFYRVFSYENLGKDL